MQDKIGGLEVRSEETVQNTAQRYKILHMKEQLEELGGRMKSFIICFNGVLREMEIMMRRCDFYRWCQEYFKVKETYWFLDCNSTLGIEYSN